MWCSAREGSFVCPLKTWLAYFDLDSFFFFPKEQILKLFSCGLSDISIAFNKLYIVESTLKAMQTLSSIT